MLRTEEWQAEVDWGISTVIVDVHEGEEVHVATPLLREFGILADNLEEVVSYAQVDPEFAWRIPYDTVAAALTQKGFVKHVDPT